MKHRVLILCTHNSSRSQMAEGLLRSLAGDQVDVMSAGSEPSRVNPYAIQAMALRGIDIRQQRSKSLSEFLGQPFDAIITVCDDAAETCPFFPGRAERIHWSFPIHRLSQAQTKQNWPSLFRCVMVWKRVSRLGCQPSPGRRQIRSHYNDRPFRRSRQNGRHRLGHKTRGQCLRHRYFQCCKNLFLWKPLIMLKRHSNFISRGFRCPIQSV